MASDILDRVGMVIADTGSITQTYVTASVLIGIRFNTPQQAGAVDTKSYWWMIEEDNDFQIFEGRWDLANTRVYIDTLWQSKISDVHSNSAKMTLAGNATLRSITPAEALNYVRFDTAQTLTAAQRNMARGNIGAFGVIRVTKYTSSGTHVPNPNMIFAVIENRGSGGGGGSAMNTGTTGITVGGGGGSGGFSRSIVSAAAFGASKSVTVGAAGVGGAAGTSNGTAGGDVSVGALCIAKGGGGGTFSQLGVVAGVAGAGGAPGTGDYVEAGFSGGPGGLSSVVTGSIVAGSGGGPGGGAAITSSSNGIAGSNYGAGGSGGSSVGSPTNFAGGNGSAGIVIITEYCSQ